MRRLLVIVGVTAALGGLFVFGISRDPNTRDDIASPRLGKTMPDFTMPLFARYQGDFGEDFSYAEAVGRPMVINFWASWCEPCRYEAPVLEAAWREFGGEVMVVGVNTQDRSRSEAEAFLDQYRITFPNGLDAQSRISIDYGTFGLPETFFIRADGTLSHRHAGPISAEAFQQQLEKIVQ